MSMTVPTVQQRSVEELIERNLSEHKRSIDEILDRFRNTVVVKALAMKGGNITATAELLQCNRTTLVRWMDEFNLRTPEDGGDE